MGIMPFCLAGGSAEFYLVLNKEIDFWEMGEGFKKKGGGGRRLFSPLSRKKRLTSSFLLCCLFSLLSLFCSWSLEL